MKQRRKGVCQHLLAVACLFGKRDKFYTLYYLCYLELDLFLVKLNSLWTRYLLKNMDVYETVSFISILYEGWSIEFDSETSEYAVIFPYGKRTRKA